MWKSILGAWIIIRLGLTKSDPSSMAEMLRQPFFGNPSFTNTNGAPLGVNGQSEGYAFTRHGHTRVKDIWNQEAQEWKSLPDLGMYFHVLNRNSKDIIINSIPRRPNTFDSNVQPGDWINNITPSSGAPLNWVYYVLKSFPNKTLALEFRRISTNGQIRATSHQTHFLLFANHFSVRVLSQEGHGATLRIVREPPSTSKKTTSYWIFESRFIKDRIHQRPPLGPRGVALESHPPTRRCPLLRLHRQKGLQKRKGTCGLTRNHHFHPKPQPPKLYNTISDCENLAQCPLKEGGHTDLADPQPGPSDWHLASTNGDSPTCNICETGISESLQHCLLDCPPAQCAWGAFKRVWEKWKAPEDVIITWPFILLGEAATEREDDPPGLHAYHVDSFTYARQPLDILRTFTLYYLWSERCRRHFGDCYFLKRVLQQAWVATVEVGMATWKAIRTPHLNKDPNIQTRIEFAFRTEWLHMNIFGSDNATIRWHFLPPLYFLNFSND